MPEKDQVRVVGEVRQKLLKEGKITFDQIVDKKTGKLYTLHDLGFSQGGDRLPSDAYEIARNGGKHSGWYNEAKNYTPKQLAKSERNLLRNVEEHEGYIADPKRHVPEWDQTDDCYKQGTIHMWKRHIQKNKEQYDIIQGIMKARGLK